MRNLLTICICTFAITPVMWAAEEHKDHAGCTGHAEHAKHDTPATMPSKDLGSKTGAAKQTICPVSGKPIDPSISAEYEGKQVYFCGKGCQAKFKRSPESYLPALYKVMYPQQVQITCPVMGEEVDPKCFVDHKGQRVYFCCKACLPKFNATPDKYLPKLVDLSTEQVHCPVSGKSIDPAISIDHKGKKVYFCGKDCIGKFKANPAKYEETLRPTAGLIAYGKSADDDLVMCPLCLSESAHKRSDAMIAQQHNGLNYAFCSSGCAAKFKAEPDKRAKALREEVIKRIGADQAFTCSMHPDVVHAGPGKCPLCNMKLEAVKAGK